MVDRVRRIVALLALTTAMVAALGAPAGAQQLVDAGREKQGGLAFVLMVVMFFAIFGVLFTMDRIRRRRVDEDPVEK